MRSPHPEPPHFGPYMQRPTWEHSFSVLVNSGARLISSKEPWRLAYGFGSHRSRGSSIAACDGSRQPPCHGHPVFRPGLPPGPHRALFARVRGGAIGHAPDLGAAEAPDAVAHASLEQRVPTIRREAWCRAVRTAWVQAHVRVVALQTPWLGPLQRRGQALWDRGEEAGSTPRTHTCRVVARAVPSTRPPRHRRRPQSPSRPPEPWGRSSTACSDWHSQCRSTGTGPR